ncbi:MAG: hypothetical protein R3324_13300, partial [Halobacteriales archaeon]|nr:hypothetical protein [Halobacteriales archaeon]
DGKGAVEQRCRGRQDQPLLPAGDAVTYWIDATVDPSATGTLTNTATVDPPTGVPDAAPEDNSDTDSDPIVPPTTSSTPTVSRPAISESGRRRSTRCP